MSSINQRAAFAKAAAKPVKKSKPAPKQTKKCKKCGMTKCKC